MQLVKLPTTQVQMVNAAIDHYNTLVHYVRSVLRENLDYGKIPGCGDKPVLFKPGAEKISTLFGFRESIERLEAVKDWTGKDFNGEPFFSFEYLCTLRDRHNNVIAQCVGSCNSWETKYRFRKAERSCPTCGAASIIKGKKEYGGGWVCFKNKGGCGAKFADGATEIEGQESGLVANTQVFDQINTIDKMAQKRAFVGAVILAANASNFFAVEHSEIDTIDGDWEPAEDLRDAQPMQRIEVIEEPIDQAQRNRDRIAVVTAVTGHSLSQVKQIAGATAAELTEDDCTEVVASLLIDFATQRHIRADVASREISKLKAQQPSITDQNLVDMFLVRLDELRQAAPLASAGVATRIGGYSID